MRYKMQDEDIGVGNGNVYVPNVGDIVQFRAPWSPSGKWEGTVWNTNAVRTVYCEVTKEWGPVPAVRLVLRNLDGRRVNMTIEKTRLIRAVGKSESVVHA
jgi:hypothetical protein